MERLPARVSVRFQTMKLSIATKPSLGGGGRHKPTEASQWENRLPWAVDVGKCPSHSRNFGKGVWSDIKFNDLEAGKSSSAQVGCSGRGKNVPTSDRKRARNEAFSF